jgi:hypothetical protein
MALKNYNLYPEDHDLCKNLISGLFQRFKTFLSEYGGLKLEIEKDRAFYQDEIVYRESAEVENFAFILFRDGIRWIEFGKALSRKEIKQFISTLKSFSKVDEDPEGDLVTAFWEADFENIRYKALDIYWDAEPITELNMLKAMDPKSIKEDFGGHSTEKSSTPATIQLERNGLFKLNNRDVDKLRKMILEEENRKIVTDLFSLISVLIRDKKNINDTKALLLFIKTELKNIVINKNFKIAFLILNGLHKIRLYSKKSNPQIASIFDGCIKSISDPSFLNVIHIVFRELKYWDPKQIKLLRKFFLLLHPIAIFSIAPILSITRHTGIQKQLFDIINILSIRDSRPLKQLLLNSDEPMLLKLLYVVDRMPEEKSKKILFTMIENRSEKVRMQAFKYLFSKKSIPIENVFPYIEDPDQTVRRLILEYLTNNNFKQSEDLLHEYLKQKRFSRGDTKHILECYKTLGTCGSSRSVEFLKNILFKNRILPSFWGSIHKKGSVIALSEIKAIEAKNILKKASRSFYPNIRIAYRKGMTELNC